MADLDIPGVKIVGYEGVFGTIMMLGVMMPIAYFLPGPEGEGIHENTLDTLTMIGNSKALQTILAIDMAALLLYNMSGMAVTGHLGAVFRTVLETMRTLFVWLIDLLLFYTPLGMGQVRACLRGDSGPGCARAVRPCVLACMHAFFVEGFACMDEHAAYGA